MSSKAELRKERDKVVATLNSVYELIEEAQDRLDRLRCFTLRDRIPPGGLDKYHLDPFRLLCDRIDDAVTGMTYCDIAGSLVEHAVAAYEAEIRDAADD